MDGLREVEDQLRSERDTETRHRNSVLDTFHRDASHE